MIFNRIQPSWYLPAHKEIQLSYQRSTLVQNQHYGVVAALKGLTFASVLIESSNPASVVYERSVIEEEGRGTVGESPVVQMVQTAVVLSSIRRPEVEIGSAEKLCLNLTGSLAGGRTVGLRYN